MRWDVWAQGVPEAVEAVEAGTMTDALDDLERDLQAYVAFWHRRGRDEFTVSMALKEHRRQVLANLHDDGDPSWNLRNGLLERLADRLHISMVDEPEVGPILDYRRELAADRRKGARA
jgi:hypothetical protein